MCNTKISLKFHADTICANLVTCWSTQNIYIIIKAADRRNSQHIKVITRYEIQRYTHQNLSKLKFKTPV